VTTTDVTMAFKKEQEQFLDVLNLQRDIIKKLTDEKEKLLKINIVIFVAY
jgi:hypothetical protein